jgi:hypothetical protein
MGSLEMIGLSRNQWDTGGIPECIKHMPLKFDDGYSTAQNRED